MRTAWGLLLIEIYSEVCPKRMAICHVVRENLEKLAGETDLGGYCAIGSVGLALAFRRSGFDAEVVVGYYMENMRHCWVISEGVIYDITMTQFGKQWPKAWAEQYEPVHPADDDVNRFLADNALNPADWKSIAEFFEYWPYRQQPTICRVGILLPTPTSQTLQLV